MFLPGSALLFLCSTASFMPVKGIPINNIQNSVYTDKLKQEQPNSRIVFGQPRFVQSHRLTQPLQLQSRIQFPEPEPEFEGDIFERIPRHHGTSFREASWKYDKSISFGSDPSPAITSPDLKSPTIKFKSNEEIKPYQYYWLRQYLSNTIGIDDQSVKTKLNQIEKIIEQEALRSSYLSLFQTPNLRKKAWLCPTGKRRDHAGNCTVPLNIVIRDRPS